ncbi:MAG: response regulator [Oscillospiraceae bacterium]
MLSLLIADDEKVIRESLAECLNWEEIGIRVVGCCANGLEALDVIIDENPDIVMTDIKMPGLNGLELIEKIQSIDRDIEFIILSGYREFDFAKKAMEFGVRRYLLKPVSEEQVLESVLDAVKSCENRRAAKTAVEERTRLRQQLPEQLLHLTEEGGKEEAEAAMRAYLAAVEEHSALRAAGAHLISGILTQQQMPEEEHEGVFDEIYRETDRDALVDRVVETALALLWKDKGGNDLVQLVKGYVRQNLADSTLSLKQIASQYAHVNVDYLSRLFVQETGEKFSHYLNRKRVEKAKQLLQGDSGKVYQVAEQVGLGHNPRYFGQVFKKYTGMTPSAFTEKQGKGKEE